MQLLLRWIISAGALYATVWILSLFQLASPGKGPWYNWFVAVVIMALVNLLIRPIALLIAAPLNCLTFGLIGILINAILFWTIPLLAAAVGMPVFQITFLGALAGSILVGLIGGLANKILIRENEKD